MKKIVICLAIISIFAYILSAQVKLVKAATSDGPITNPVTTPVTFYEISGKILDQISNILKPEAGAAVTITNLSNNYSKSFITDDSGNFHFYGGNGNYQLRISDHNGTAFTPHNLDITVNNASVSGLIVVGSPK